MIEFDATLLISPDAAAAQLMASLVGSNGEAALDTFAIPRGDASDDAVLQDLSQPVGDEWIPSLLSSASPGAVAAGTFSPGAVNLLNPQSMEGEEEHEITINGRGYRGHSYSWDGNGGDGSASGGTGSTGGGGGYAAPVAQHTQDCGSEDGAAVQVARHVKGELPLNVSGPVDPVKTSIGNDWTKVEFGAIIVKNADGSFGALNDTIYSNDLNYVVAIGYNPPQPVQGVWHSHPPAGSSSPDQLVDRYPSLTDWNSLARVAAGTGTVLDPSLWIMDAFGTTREFKLSERAYFENLHKDRTKMEHGEGLEGRERTQSCG